MKEVKVAGNVEIFPDPGLRLVALSGVEMRPVEWLWPGVIPRGKLVLFGGQPSAGKTTAALSIVAAETRGERFPLSEHRGNGGSAIIFSAEDDVADTLAPRLVAAGADTSRVFVQQSTIETAAASERFALLSRDLVLLETALRARPDIALVVFDPLSAYLGAKDSHRDADVREVLGPVTQLAADFRVTILGITHLNKSEGLSAMARFTGSGASVAAARAAFLFAKHNDVSIMVPVKSNLAKMARALTYRIEPVLLTEHNPAIPTSRTAWLEEVDVTAEDVLGAERDTNKSARDEAREFIEELLQNGPMRAGDMEAKLKAAGFDNERTWRRAKKELGIVSAKDAFSGGWRWFTAEQYRLWKENQAGQFGPDDRRLPTPVAAFEDPKNASFSQNHEFGSLGENKSLKASSSKPSTEGCHDFEYLAALAAEHPTCNTKAANCEGIGDPWHSWAISELLERHPVHTVGGPSEPCGLVH